MTELTREKALALSRGLKATPKVIARLNATIGDEEAVRWAVAQWELRERAQSKFKRASEYIFTREALEQATREDVAAYHASRFPRGELVADLTAGIGGDLLALARRGPVIGYETDPERAEYAHHNAVTSGHLVQIIAGDCMAHSWPDYAFADPSRRVDGRRTLDVRAFEPDPTVVADRMGHLKLGGLKLTPFLSDRLLSTLGPEIAFVASGDECPEVVVWTGSQAVSSRYAIWGDTGEALAAGGLTSSCDEPMTYLFEAHPAAIRAHALGTICKEFRLVALGNSNGYLTGEQPVMSRWLKTYRLLHAGKGDIRQTKAALKAMGAGTPIIKSRAGIDVEALRKELRSQGSSHPDVVVAVYPVGKSIRHAILERISQEPIRT